MGELRQIFFSYGHDKNKMLVEKLADDIASAAKVPVWIDKTGLRAGDHWRRKIQNAIDSSDLFFSFASKYSVRNPGVCLDELRIAINIRHALIQTVKLEKDIEPPSNITELQMIDMSGWEEHYCEGSGQFDESWYSEKLNCILKVLKAPENLEYAEEIEFIKKTLNPNTSDSIRAEKIGKPFFGREWLLREMENWIQNSRERALWITGNPGTGKSSFIARSFFYIDNILATIYCSSKTKMNTADSVFRLLIFKLSVSLHDYRRRVYSLLQQDRSILDSTDKMISVLLVEPLSNLIDGKRDPLVIMIDGLDELDKFDLKKGRRTNPIADLIEGSNMFDCIRPYFRFIITCRPQTIKKHRGAAIISIGQDDRRNIEDIRSFLENELSDEAGKYPPEIFRGYIEQICRKADGIILYAWLVIEDIRKGKIFLEEADALPSGLDGYYLAEFDKMFSGSSYDRVFSLPLTLLASFPEGLTKNTLLYACRTDMEWDERDERRFSDQFASFLAEDNNTIRLFHKSLRDWLLSDPAESYQIYDSDLRLGRRLTAKGCFQLADECPDEINDQELFTLCSLLAENGIWRGKSDRKEREDMRLQLSENEKFLAILSGKTHLAVEEYDYDLLQQCVSALRTILDPDEKKTIADHSPAELDHLMTYRYAQGKICEHRNDLSTAAEWYQPIESIDKELLKELDPEKVILLWDSYAFCEYRRGEFHHSTELYQQLINYLESVGKTDSEAWLHARIELIGVYRGDSLYDRVFKAVDDLKSRHTDLLQQFPALWYKLLKYEAWTLKNRGRLSDARKVIEEAETQRSLGIRADPYDTAVMLLNYSYIFLSEHDFETALEKVRQGCEICKEIHGADSLKITEFYDRYGEIYQRMAAVSSARGAKDAAADSFRKAEESFIKAYEIRDANYHDSNLYMNFSLHHLIDLYLYQDTKFDQIRDMIEREIWILQNVRGKTGDERVKEEMSRIAREAVLFCAAREVGYVEKSKEAFLADPSCLYDKLAGAGEDNYTKFGKELHDVYPEVMDFPAPWCDAFADWCYYKTFGEDRARSLLGDFDDYTVKSAEYFKKRNQWYTRPLVGTQIFFHNEIRICHTGLVYGYDREFVYTIEGNTHGADESFEHGGGVTRKVYSRLDPCIEGYGGFLYTEVQPEEITVREDDLRRE